MKENIFSSNTNSRSQPSHYDSDTENEQSDNESSNNVDVPTDYQLSDTLLAAKVRAISELPEPRNAKEAEAALGLMYSSGDTLKITPKKPITFPKNQKEKTRKHFLMDHSKNSIF
ncbi:hypothetical protein ACTFIR_007571 [Dictyostelium discoideum]